jgi:hypothetical protein
VPTASVMSGSLNDQSKALAKIKHAFLSDLADLRTFRVKHRPHPILDDLTRQRSQSCVIAHRAIGVRLWSGCFCFPIGAKNRCLKLLGSLLRTLKIYCSGRCPEIQYRTAIGTVLLELLPLDPFAVNSGNCHELLKPFKATLKFPQNTYSRLLLK